VLNSVIFFFSPTFSPCCRDADDADSDDGTTDGAGSSHHTHGGGPRDNDIDLDRGDDDGDDLGEDEEDPLDPHALLDYDDHGVGDDDDGFEAAMDAATGRTYKRLGSSAENAHHFGRLASHQALRRTHLGSARIRREIAKNTIKLEQMAAEVQATSVGDIYILHFLSLKCHFNLITIFF
jgi:hypothetical protein